MVAGQLIEEVSGRTWEQFVRDEIFKPLDMDESTVSDREFQSTADRARPHSRSGGGLVGLGTLKPLDENATLAANAAPAGGLSISADDMTHWLLTQLGRGKIPGSDKRLFSAEQSAEMWNGLVPQPISPLPPEFKPTEPNFELYALGWDVRDYRGAKLIWHGGAVFGSLAAVALLPEQNVGIYIATNSEEGQIVRGLLYELLDHYLGAPQSNWPEKFHAFRQKRLANAAAQVAKQTAQPAKIGPSLALDRYAGDYADPWYGTIKVRRSGKAARDPVPAFEGDGWPADASSVRHLPDQPVAGLDRAGLRHLRAGRRRQSRPHHDESRLADRRLQLRLPRPAVHARRREAVSPRLRGMVDALGLEPRTR